MSLSDDSRLSVKAFLKQRCLNTHHQYGSVQPPEIPAFANDSKQLLWSVYKTPADQITMGKISQNCEKEESIRTLLVTIGRLLTKNNRAQPWRPEDIGR